MIDTFYSYMDQLRWIWFHHLMPYFAIQLQEGEVCSCCHLVVVVNTANDPPPYLQKPVQCLITRYLEGQAA